MSKDCHSADHPISGIGTPDDIRQYLRKFEAAGADQVILMQQSGQAKHGHISESMELFASVVMPEFKARAAAHSEKRQKEMAPYIEAAMARKKFLKPMEEHEVNAVTASVKISSYTD